MRRNIALLLIGVIVLAGAAGVLAMTNMTKTNKTLNATSTVNNTAQNNANTSADTDDKQQTSSSSSNINNNDDNGGTSEDDTLCPVCEGRRGYWDSSGKFHACETCGGTGHV